MIAEPVMGAGGVIVPPKGYYEKIQAVCRKYDMLFIADEVMCGMGRTGTLYAVEQEGVVPDLVAIAKGLGGGYQAIGGVLVQQRIVEALSRGSGRFQHGHTYIGHPVACAAALAVQQVIERDGLMAAVRSLGARLRQRLHERFDAHAAVGDIRGRGLFMAIELVADRASKAPFDPALTLHARIKAQAMARGLMVYPMGGTIDGQSGDHVLLAPPFISQPAQIDEIVHRLGEAVDAALAEAGAKPQQR